MKTKFILSATVALLALAGLGGPATPTARAAEASAADPEPPPPRRIPMNPSNPVEIQYKVGFHDMDVPEANSHTSGVNLSASLSGTLFSGTHIVLEGDMFLDFDHDHLDPHHTPLWLQLHFGLTGPIAQSTTPDLWYFSWVGDVNSRSNTVSCIERDLKIIPGVALGGKLGILAVEARLGYGYYALTIDDDVPRERGYDRDDLINRTWALAPSLEATLSLTPHFKVLGRAQEWHDGSTWLETKYHAGLDWDLSRFIPHADLEFSVEVTEYNISMYHPTGSPPGYLPILPWNDDRLIMFTFDKWW